MEKSNESREAMANGKSFVKVAPPTVHAGVGNALRQAYQLDNEIRSMRGFEDLIKQLD